MKALIRFEDRYGMATVVQQMCMLLHEGEDIEALGYEFENDKSIAGVLKLETGDFAILYRSGVRRVVFVFDLDGDNIEEHQLMKPEWLLDAINGLETHLRMSEIDMQLEYVPTVYLAETIALYQHLNKLQVMPELCVNRNSFKTFQISLLRMLFQLKNERDVKRFPEYLIPDNIITVANLQRSVFNARLFEILLDLESHGYNKEEAVEHCRTVVQLFDDCIEAGVSVNLFGHNLTSDMSVDEMRQQVTNYLISIGKKQRR